MVNEQIKNNIKSYRVRLGYTQSDMAKKLNISRQKYIKCENNPLNTKLSILVDISHLLKCSVSDFFIPNDVT